MNRFFLLAALFLGALAGVSGTANAQLSIGYNSYYYRPAQSFGYASYYYRPAPRPVAHYEADLDPRLVRAAAIADANAHPHSTLRCWQYVKRALLDAGVVTSYPSTNYAWQAGSELKSKFGFVRLSVKDPYHAPVGAVIVYEGHGAGHVELRTARGFASDYHSPWACRYAVSGIYAKLVN